MSKKDMLGLLTRALVGVPQDRLPLVLDVAHKLGDEESGGAWHGVLSKAMRAGLPGAPQAKAPKSEPLGSIIRVDRAVRPSYPDWVQRVMHPELEATGPAEYDLADDVEQWLHGKQKGGVASGNEIYEHLKEGADELKNHLDLHDLQAIQKLGIKVFRKHFAGKTVFGWKSIVLNRHGNFRFPSSSRLVVPLLLERSRKVKLLWCWLSSNWGDSDPALRFRK